MAKRLFFGEFGLAMVGVPYAILRQEYLSQVEERAAAEKFVPHIYMVVQRPRLTLDPKSIVITKERIKGVFHSHRRGALEPIPWERPNPFGESELKFECEYPYNTFAFTAPDGREVGGEVSTVLTSFQIAGPKVETQSALDLEILYVGQAYGKKGERSAMNRLARHETLQKIYSDANRRAPEMDVLIILWRFEETQLATFFPPEDEDTSEDALKAEEERTARMLAATISEEQKVNFTEAALIRYFQPVYNTQFKDQFPTPAHASYAECYKIDLNMVSAEIHTMSVQTKLWGPGAPSALMHFATFPLHSEEERRHMFDFVDFDVLVRGPAL